MRVADSSYEGYVKHLATIVASLPVGSEMHASFLQQIEDYCDAADPVRGAPQLNAPWTPGNARAGYQTDVPGLISEILAQYVLSRIYGEAAILVAQDQITQVIRAIDMFINTSACSTIGGQSKTIRFDGSKLHINPLWGNGEADWVILTDIDDHETFVVPIAFIRDNANKIVQYRDLKQASIHYYNLHGVYK